MKFASSGGADAWPATDYLNIWVCHLGGGLLGYAQFPGGPAATDGVVVDYRAFGTLAPAAPPYALGRTCTHEVGHWLDLFHTFKGGCSGGGDQCTDTPAQSAPNYGCPSHPHASCTSADMFMNFMDYTDDSCMSMFSADQALRMEATLSVTRASLQGSLGHVPAVAGGPDLWIADDEVDVGNEPNTQSPYMWTSSDVWVRNVNDGGIVHQNPEYTSSTNHVYVRVRNRGCVASSPATLKVYWAKASSGLSWPTPWDDGVTTPPDMGQPIGALSTGVIPAASSVVFVLPWNPLPNPADYASFGADRSHFCLLARVETSATSPFGMTVPETSDLYGNVKANNNIAWKNISILVDGERESVAMAANATAQTLQVRLVVRLGLGAPVTLPGNALRLELSPTLHQKWVAGGSQGAGMQAVGGTVLHCLADNAYLGNIGLAPGEVATMRVRAGPGLLVGPQRTLTIRVEQRNEQTLAVIGGQDFVLPMGIDYSGAQVIPFGVGCPSSLGVPSLVASTPPIIGTVMQMQLGQLPFGLGLLIFGFGNTAAGVTPLPLNLAFLGAPGCDLLVSNDVLQSAVGVGTTASASLAIPNAPGLVGLEVFSQAAAIDPLANALGIAFSAANTLVLGN